MFPTRALFVASLAACACAHPAAAAAETPAWSLDASAAVSIKRFGYKEYSDAGRLLDEESGNLPGAVLALGLAREDWRIEAELAGHGGTVDYDGQTTLGTPVRTRTDTALADASLRLARRYALARAEVTPYAGAGWHYWDRDIRSTRTSGGTYVYGLREVYRWYSIELGLRAMVDTAVESLRVGLDLRGLRIVRPTMDFDGAGLYDRATLSLGERNGWRVAVPLEYSLGPAATLRAELYAERWEFGRSATQNLTSGGVVVGTVHEPRSESRMIGLTLGAVFRF
jgi:hypothetical protein